MIAFKLKDSIDWKSISDAVDRGEQKALKRMGGLVRGAARRRIQYRKKKKAAPKGRAPYTHDGKRINRALKESIKTSILPGSVIIGPAKSWVGNIGSIHEFGKTVNIVARNPQFMRKIKIGQGGPVSSKKYAGKIIKGSEYKDPLDGSPIVWCKIKTKRMLEHSERLMKRLMKSTAKSKLVNYPIRPFMKPTLDELIQKGKLPSAWRATIG